jgi:hypothetical protein
MPMTIIAAVGQAQALDAREAGLQAAHQALSGLGSISPVLGIIISPHRFDPHLVASGVSSLFANMPLIGFSSSAALTKAGVHPHAVVVAFLAGESIQAEAHWFPAYSQAGAETGMRIMQLLGYEQQRPAESVLVFADGLNGNAEEFCESVPADMPVVGGLSSGDPQSQNSYQIAGLQAGQGGMAAAFLRGNVTVGIGYGHGWHPVGSRFRITRSRGFWVRTLDGHPASESYARMFGKPAREWSFPPLNYLTRIYPLGFEQAHTDALKVRAPIRVEADGSFRMNALLRDGTDGYLLIGSPADCYGAAKQAARHALETLGQVKPIFALVLVDAAWQTILEANPGSEIDAIREVLGDDLPIAGGYTLGQIVPGGQSGEEHPTFLNQHIVVTLFGERKD